jgi:hypothetical protein
VCAVALLALAARGGEKLVTLVLGFGVPVLAVLALRALSVPLESVPVRWPRHHQVHNLQLASFTSSSGILCGWRIPLADQLSQESNLTFKTCLPAL